VCKASVTYKPLSTTIHDTRRSCHAAQLFGFLLGVFLCALHSVMGPACVCVSTSELLELPGAGHMFWDSDLEKSVQHIAGFLARNEPPSSPQDEAMPTQ
jgi:hypothetical protein